MDGERSPLGEGWGRKEENIVERDGVRDSPLGIGEREWRDTRVEGERTGPYFTPSKCQQCLQWFWTPLTSMRLHTHHLTPHTLSCHLHEVGKVTTPHTSKHITPNLKQVSSNSDFLPIFFNVSIFLSSLNDKVSSEASSQSIDIQPLPAHCIPVPDLLS